MLRFVLSVLVFLALAPASWAQSGEVRCPARGTRFTFSDGGQIEAVGAGTGAICRMKNIRTGTEFERLYGIFVPTSALVKANMEKLQSFAPLRVGQKVSFSNSGGSDRGQDGIWFYELMVDKTEPVQTPAGTFEAFLIRYDEESPQTTKGLWRRRYWYAPQVGYTVKFEYQAIHGLPPQNYPRNWILTELKPAGAAK